LIREKFIPIQIEEELCLRCERCTRTCRNNAIYFDQGIRRIDYTKCKACLDCVNVCPRNAITVISVQRSNQILNIKIDRNKCTLCGICLNDNGKYCPQNLFYKEKLKNKIEIVKFKNKEIDDCQGCLNCVVSCPEQAIIPFLFNIQWD